MSKPVPADAAEMLDAIDGALSDADQNLDSADLSAFIAAVNRLWERWKAKWRNDE